MIMNMNRYQYLRRIKHIYDIKMADNLSQQPEDRRVTIARLENRKLQNALDESAMREVAWHSERENLLEEIRRLEESRCTHEQKPVLVDPCYSHY